jgi:broad specificity phosphatase PhoE
VLVRHSVPDIRRDIPAAEWRLSDTGKRRAREFARLLDPGTARTIHSSEEPKAVETARALAAEWDCDVSTAAGFHEHERPAAQMLTRDAFEARVRDLFARPAERVFGAETADQARRRFTMALMRAVAASSTDIIVVSHGTVITLFVAEAAGVEPFAFWKKLEMPSAVEMSLPDLQVSRYLGSDGP